MRGPLDGVAVLFDLDGTLIDTAGDLAASMNHVLAHAGHATVPAPRVRHLVGHGARAMLKSGFAEGGAPAPDEKTLDAHVAAFVDHYRDHIAVHSRPFPGAVAAIEALKSDGAAIAICTNKPAALARALIDALGLTRHFAAIVGPDSAGAAKPDPRPVQLCLKLAERTRGVFVGDSDTDIKAAASMNMPCLAALFGYGPLDLVGEAFATFSTYDAAPALIRRAAQAG